MVEIMTGKDYMYYFYQYIVGTGAAILESANLIKSAVDLAKILVGKRFGFGFDRNVPIPYLLGLASTSLPNFFSVTFYARLA